MKYKIHRFDLKMTSDQHELEQFLNSLAGEIIAITPNITLGFSGLTKSISCSLWKR